LPLPAGRGACQLACWRRLLPRQGRVALWRLCQARQAGCAHQHKVLLDGQAHVGLEAHVTAEICSQAPHGAHAAVGRERGCASRDAAMRGPALSQWSLPARGLSRAGQQPPHLAGWHWPARWRGCGRGWPGPGAPRHPPRRWAAQSPPRWQRSGRRRLRLPCWAAPGAAAWMAAPGLRRARRGRGGPGQQRRGPALVCWVHARAPARNFAAGVGRPAYSRAATQAGRYLQARQSLRRGSAREAARLRAVQGGATLIQTGARAWTTPRCTSASEGWLSARLCWAPRTRAQPGQTGLQENPAGHVWHRQSSRSRRSRTTHFDARDTGATRTTVLGQLPTAASSLISASARWSNTAGAQHHHSSAAGTASRSGRACEGIPPGAASLAAVGVSALHDPCGSPGSGSGGLREPTLPARPRLAAGWPRGMKDVEGFPYCCLQPAGAPATFVQRRVTTQAGTVTWPVRGQGTLLAWAVRTLPRSSQGSTPHMQPMHTPHCPPPGPRLQSCMVYSLEYRAWYKANVVACAGPRVKVWWAATATPGVPPPATGCAPGRRQWAGARYVAARALPQQLAVDPAVGADQLLRLGGR
jgi:hypothetical protein